MWERIELPDADVRIDREFLAGDTADRLCRELHSELAWRRDRVRVFGREHPIPRMHQWYGDSEASYRWSGLPYTSS